MALSTIMIHEPGAMAAAHRHARQRRLEAKQQPPRRSMTRPGDQLAPQSSVASFDPASDLPASPLPARFLSHADSTGSLRTNSFVNAARATTVAAMLLSPRSPATPSRGDVSTRRRSSTSAPERAANHKFDLSQANAAYSMEERHVAAERMQRFFKRIVQGEGLSRRMHQIIRVKHESRSHLREICVYLIFLLFFTLSSTMVLQKQGASLPCRTQRAALLSR